MWPEMKIDRHLYILLLPVFLLACARQTSPTGGPKDTIPPVLKTSIPQQGKTQYDAQYIELVFNELVALNNPREQILITPDINKKYKATAKKNKVVIQLENPLKENTTYTFNFRESIHDITEKNPVRNLKLAFSTGKYIDSLSIAGTVYDLQKDEPLKDATVAIYAQDTFNIFNHRPSYVTRTNDKGDFILENLKDGAYKIYAFDDKNKNLQVDSKNESYGFLADSIELKKNVSRLRIGLVKLDARPLKITSSRAANTYYNIKLSKGISAADIRVDQTAKPTPAPFTISEDRQNIKVYNSFGNPDSTAIKITASDSIGQRVDTTLYAKFSTRPTKPEPFTTEVTDQRLLSNKGILQATVTFSKPIVNTTPDSMYFQPDSITRIPILPNDLRWQDFGTRLLIEKSIDKKFFTPTTETTIQQQPSKQQGKNGKTKNLLYFGKGAFISAENDSSAVISESLKASREDELGILIVQIETTWPHYIVEILTRDFKVIRRTINKAKVTFTDLQPGEYMIRIIHDRDQNNEWTPGNFYKGTEPEKIVYYRTEKKQQTVNLKANWELGPLLIRP